MKYLKLIRYQNLLLLAFMQLIFCFGFLKLEKIDLALANWQYFLLVLSTVCIAAGGYIINNIMDQDSDLENKPKDVVVGKSISETMAYNLYIGFTLTGVCIGFYLSNVIIRPSFLLVFILPSALLYIYATSLKQVLIVGNVVVATMLSLSIIIIGLFMIFPATADDNRTQMRIVFSVLIDYAIITFIINFIREIVKDLEDIKGDYKQGMKTLPIVLGESKTTKLVFALSFVPIFCILYYVYNYLFQLQYATVYILAFIIGPLLYFSIKIGSAKTKKEYTHLSNVLKLVVFFGIISITIIALNKMYYVA
ncbi:geranylgeranylglycerol-phosphate geranylgeranyltransferase [Flavobacterium sp.]|uniref:geranylgeranylglycerol-phosphate geranylgeranyltransferase n=1 Tax=Flavobacterium sp. TaxID=239 RepID=UPI00286D9A3F|nr:geranylgeranylglycerol-phosphate geranylgeranyltransferase [Flavobacterium sp.]